MTLFPDYITQFTTVGKYGEHKVVKPVDKTFL